MMTELHDANTSSGSSPTLNLANFFLLDRLREGKGDRIALRIGDATISYQEVVHAALGYVQWSRVRKVGRESRVMIAIPEGLAFVAGLFGALMQGCVAVPVNPESSPEALAKLVTYIRPRVLLARAELLQPEVLRACEKNAVEICALADSLDIVERQPFAQLLDSSTCLPIDLDAACIETHPDEAAIWLFSGGTTGTPKAVAVPHAAFVNTTRCYGHGVLGLASSDITISVPKLHFGYALGSNLFFPFSVGASVVLDPHRCTPERLEEQMLQHRPTIAVLVPTMIGRLVQRRSDEVPSRWSSLRLATSAGEALPEPLLARWQQGTGVELLDGLGTAEMWHIFLTNHPGQSRPGSIGRVVAGFEVKICDEAGKEVTQGETGWLWVRGESRALGYWLAHQKSCDVFRGQWVVTGDMLRQDEDGYYFYCGRGTEMTKVAGQWFSSKEVEDLVMQIAGVHEAAVFCVSGVDGLARPYAVVDTDSDVTAQEIANYLNAKLPGYKIPRRIFVRSDLPRTHLGKIDRAKLRAEIQRTLHEENAISGARA